MLFILIIFLHLHIQCRSNENERLIFTEEKHKKQRKHKKLIDILTKERNQLQLQLSAIQEGPHARREIELEQQIQKLLEELENSQKLLDSEKSNLWELEGHIKKVMDTTI